MELLKITLFKDCRNSRSEFFEIRCKESHNEPIMYSCCECRYSECHHYDNMSYIAKESKQYYKDMCPSCVLKVDKPCNRFWNCCITRMQHQKAFATIQQAASFASECFYFKYKCAYIELCVEGNVYENACRHMMRYFANIDMPEPFTSQCFKQLSMSDKVVLSGKASPSVALLNTTCKTHSNGLRCANCEMLDKVNRNAYYMPL